jgi:two-component system, NtrC family, sensor histidine kinase HydH
MSRERDPVSLACRARVETVAAEIAHDLTYPINYFRALLDRLQHGERLDAEDLEIGREEVARLERVIAYLRIAANPELHREPCKLAEIVAQAVDLACRAHGGGKVDVAVSAELVVRCDVGRLIVALGCLLENALEATRASGKVGIRAERVPSGVLLEVWDEGLGFEGEARQLFAPWYSSDPSRLGLGLTVAHRLLRAEGRSIEGRREHDQTRFSISIPKHDLVASEVGAETEHA